MLKLAYLQAGYELQAYFYECSAAGKLPCLKEWGLHRLELWYRTSRDSWCRE